MGIEDEIDFEASFCLNEYSGIGPLIVEWMFYVRSVNATAIFTHEKQLRWQEVQQPSKVRHSKMSIERSRIVYCLGLR